MRLVVLLLLACVALASQEASLQDVVVKRGDTLWGIANVYLKDPARWDEILKYNHLGTSDPTVALPGMILKVPVFLIKESLRAARLVYILNRVGYRRKETADWRPSAENMELFRGDSLRTYEDSKAKVKFLNADLLSLDANSMAVIKPVDQDADVVLKSGGLFVGHSRVITVSATVTPKTRDTQYSAKVRADLSTLVEVYTGLAAVTAQGRTVDVKAGMASAVPLGLAPGLPQKIADLPDFEARAAEFNGSLIQGEARLRLAKGAQLALGADADSLNKAPDAGDLTGDVASLRVGVPISGYRVQVSRTRDFEKVVFDKVFDPDERFRLGEQVLAPGVYWFRVALIDLLGAEGQASAPRLYSVGLGGRLAAARGSEAAVDLKTAVVVYKPASDEEVTSRVYQVSGLIKFNTVTVTVNGRAVREDEDGRFFLDVQLKPGANDLRIRVADQAGGSTTISRRVVLR